MTDTKLLKQIIIESGVKFAFIAEKLGISNQALFNKFKSEFVDFKCSQVKVLVDVLHLNDEQAKAIFFAKDVDK